MAGFRRGWRAHSVICLVCLFCPSVLGTSKTGDFLWKYPTSSLISTSVVVSDDGEHAFAANWEGLVSSVSIQDGSENWQFESPNRLSSELIILPGELLGFGDHDKQFTALHQTNGTVNWSIQLDVVVNGGVYDETYDLFYVASVEGKAMAIDVRDRSVVWEKDTVSKHSGAPLVRKNKVFYAAGSALVALSKHEGGDVAWQFESSSGNKFVGPPLFSHGGVYATSGTHLYRVDASDGTEDWSVDLGEKVHGFLSQLGDSLFVACEKGTLTALDILTGTELWRTSTGGRLYGSPLVIPTGDGMVCIGTSEGKMQCVSALQGKLAFDYFTAQREMISGQPTVTTKALIFGSFDGNVYALAIHRFCERDGIWPQTPVHSVGRADCPSGFMGYERTCLPAGEWAAFVKPDDDVGFEQAVGEVGEHPEECFPVWCDADGEWPKTIAGDVVELGCPTKYVGYRSRECTDVGEFADVEDYCEKLSCPPEGAWPKTYIEEWVEVDCEKGYSGTRRRYCREDGVFQSVERNCEVIYCEEVDIGEEDDVSVHAPGDSKPNLSDWQWPRTRAGTEAAIDCPDGYRGKRTRVCEWEGSFEPSVVMCERLVCQGEEWPDVPSGNTKTIACAAGYGGTQIRHCGLDGIFEDANTSGCYATCGPENEWPQTRVGESISLPCPGGGEGVIVKKCKSDHMFELVKDDCLPHCEGLDGWPSTLVDESAEIPCERGYSGTQRRPCVDQNVWGDVDSEGCVRLECHESTIAVDLYDGEEEVELEVNFVKTYSGTLGQALCPKTFSGVVFRNCSWEAAWSSETTLACEPLFCEELEGVYGYWPLTRAGSVAERECEVGFTGKITRPCDENGSFSAVIDSCEPLYCDLDETEDVIWPPTMAGREVSVHCPSGELGAMWRTCDRTGAWEDVVDFCLQTYCTGNLAWPHTRAGDTSTTNCPLGIVGTMSRQCRVDAEFDAIDYSGCVLLGGAEVYVQAGVMGDESNVDGMNEDAKVPLAVGFNPLQLDYEMYVSSDTIFAEIVLSVYARIDDVTLESAHTSHHHHNPIRVKVNGNFQDTLQMPLEFGMNAFNVKIWNNDISTSSTKYNFFIIRETPCLPQNGWPLTNIDHEGIKPCEIEGTVKVRQCLRGDMAVGQWGSLNDTCVPVCPETVLFPQTLLHHSATAYCPKDPQVLITRRCTGWGWADVDFGTCDPRIFGGDIETPLGAEHQIMGMNDNVFMEVLGGALVPVILLVVALSRFIYVRRLEAPQLASAVCGEYGEFQVEVRHSSGEKMGSVFALQPFDVSAKEHHDSFGYRLSDFFWRKIRPVMLVGNEDEEFSIYVENNGQEKIAFLVTVAEESDGMALHLGQKVKKTKEGYLMNADHFIPYAFQKGEFEVQIDIYGVSRSFSRAKKPIGIAREPTMSVTSSMKRVPVSSTLQQSNKTKLDKSDHRASVRFHCIGIPIKDTPGAARRLDL